MGEPLEAAAEACGGAPRGCDSVAATRTLEEAQPLASLRECKAAVRLLGARLTQADGTIKEQVQDRTVSCRVPDLDVTFRGRFVSGELVDVSEAVSSERADIRLTVSSDDLVDLVHGRLAFAHAWATGRLRLDASFRDLLRLRSLIG